MTDRGTLLAAKIAAGAVGVLALLALAFVWNEARDEVFYLCGNFAPGVTEQSVMTQLDTANLLQVERSENVITVDSLFTLGLHTCVIEIDQTGVVTHAAFH